MIAPSSLHGLPVLLMFVKADKPSVEHVKDMHMTVKTILPPRHHVACSFMPSTPKSSGKPS
ncbi:hypothetical protein PC116_g17759 [Phytophthora cactorum]|nr:hypothetical protein Pcac1_g3205 [Phytophthora cactorum]KAG4042225.1 hypothetical protein PC123_g22274 [Phytophthora cactorum]KAG4234061.1 hypothetical protein PC116_g17759 [Phytophthora cactorum]